MDHATERTAVVGVLAVVAAFASTEASGLVQPVVPSSPARVVVHAGRLLDVTSGRWVLNQNIVIEAGTIARVEAGAAPRCSTCTRLISGAWICPSTRTTFWI
jgi:adenine deaminase